MHRLFLRVRLPREPVLQVPPAVPHRRRHPQRVRREAHQHGVRPVAFQIPIPATWETERSYLTAALAFAVEKGLCKPGAMVAVIGGVPKEVVITKEAASSHVVPSFHVTVAPGVFDRSPRVVENEHAKANAVRTVSLRATAISLDEVFSPEAPVRKTKIVCTMGPKCWDEELGQLIDAGMGVARFNFSHGDHGAQQKVLDRARKVAAEKGSFLAYLLDTKGPEIRTGMLKDHEPIELEAASPSSSRLVGTNTPSSRGTRPPRRPGSACRTPSCASR